MPLLDGGMDCQRVSHLLEQVLLLLYLRILEGGEEFLGFPVLFDEQIDGVHGRSPVEVAPECAPRSSTLHGPPAPRQSGRAVPQRLRTNAYVPAHEPALRVPA